MIPYGRQSISEEDIQSVIETLRSDWLTQGPAIQRFEEAVANYCKAKHAVVACNGTAALHLACLALELGPGDILWTSPITFVASANCALYCGAEVDFVDIDPKTFNMSVVALEGKLVEAKKRNRLPKVVVPVHFAGQSCEMKEVKKLADEYGFYVIEDACHALGGSYFDTKVGSCKYSDITISSFHPVKIITTGEGGIALTNSAELAKKLAMLRTHGITRDAEDMVCPKEGGWYYQQIALGYNYRITDIQAALGLSQMKRLDEFVKRRNLLAKRYDAELSEFPLSVQKQNPEIYSAYHLYVIKLRVGDIGKSRLEIFNNLRESKIGVNIHYIPVHLQPYYQQIGFKRGDFPVAENYYDAAITLPLYPKLSDSQQELVVETLRKILR